MISKTPSSVNSKIAVHLNIHHSVILFLEFRSQFVQLSDWLVIRIVTSSSVSIDYETPASNRCYLDAISPLKYASQLRLGIETSIYYPVAYFFVWFCVH